MRTHLIIHNMDEAHEEKETIRMYSQDALLRTHKIVTNIEAL